MSWRSYDMQRAEERGYFRTGDDSMPTVNAKPVLSSITARPAFAWI